MRRLCVALGVALLLPARAWPADLRNFEDAPLRAIQFVDQHEGWAVGDDGVVWHSIDGGKNWERQATGVRASLRSICFVDPYTGWVAGREELPGRGGSVGVLLFTHDGGLKWQRAAANAMPGLNAVRFVDARQGWVAGDGSDQYPSGVFKTSDGGKSWQPLAGPRATSWLQARLLDGQTGVLTGAWGRITTIRQGQLADADVDSPEGRAIRSVAGIANRVIAVGQGGLVMVSDSAGARWGHANLSLSTEVQASWDLSAVAAREQQVWAVGRPGSVFLHSSDAGESWQVRRTGGTLPLHGVFFLDARRGWAVGDHGTILTTEDGGNTWQVARRGGRRVAVLFVHGGSSAVPLEAVAELGGADGYLVAGLRITAPDPASAPADQATPSERLGQAMRRTGGAAGEVLWHFAMPQHATGAEAKALLSTWDQVHSDRAGEQVLRQLVLAIRMWRPDVVVTDHPDAAVTGTPSAALVAEAVKEAFQRAADPAAFPEQIKEFQLQPWSVSKLYSLWHGRAGAQVVHDTTAIRPVLESTLREFVMEPAGLLHDSAPTLPAQRCYRLLASRVDGAEGHRHLLQGIALSTAGENRRAAVEVREFSAEVEKALRTGRNLIALAEDSTEGLADPNRLLAQIGSELKALPDEQAARAAFRIATQYAKMGRWPLAREVYQLMVERHPVHPMAADAFRWLIRHSSSSEARHRQESSQRVVATEIRARVSNNVGGDDIKFGVRGGVDLERKQEVALIGSAAETRAWYQSCAKFAQRLSALGPVFAEEPSVQFCLQASRRQLGDFETARKWYSQFRAEQAKGTWSDNAAAELWLANRAGLPPRPIAYCRQTATRPYLDGQLDDACWQGVQPLVLRDAVGGTTKEYTTEAWLAHDRDFLYLALRCSHPEGRALEPVKARGVDADLRRFDRVSLLLDLDRDYATCFHLQIDQRGCVFDDCWGDWTWNPRWFVAIKSEPTSWQIEAAIPLTELTGEGVTIGKTWACNLVRVLPGRGVQAWSQPADVEPRPEGLGLLHFIAAGRKE